MGNWSDKGPICPYCRHEHGDGDDEMHIYDEDMTEFICRLCDEEFSVEVHTKYSWVTSKREDEEA